MSNTLSYAPPDGSMIERTGKPIWENLYGMRVPYVETLDAERLKTSGMPSVHNRMMDRQMHQDDVNVFITIDAMVEYYRRGVLLTFQNSLETREVYDLVNNYLLAWSRQLENGLNMGNVPIEDLMLLDRFAEALYPVAIKFGAVPRTGGNLFANLLNTGLGITRSSFFGHAEEQSKTQAVSEDKHDSQSGRLAESIARLRANWM